MNNIENKVRAFANENSTDPANRVRLILNSPKTPQVVDDGW